jgi:LacI family repressor for deo operon, udp, cdd, tsx, nupC, and nupG
MFTTNGTPRARRATIEDVASAAGVSVATVSRAIRGLPNVANSTRQHVIDVADELGYSADPAASRLAAGRTKTITVVIPNLSGWYFSNVVAGAEAVCAEAGYDMLVVGVGSRSDLSRILCEQYHLERRTDGLLAVEVLMSPDEAASVIERGVVLTSVGSRTAGHPSVRIDNELVGRTAADHLVELGHRRIGMIGAQKNNPMSFDVPALRYNGFVHALAAQGVEFDDELLASGNFGVDGGQEAMAALLDHDAPPTAVFSMSDEMAFGAIMELNERDLVAGRDVSLIGVDDHEFSRVVSLTTVHQAVADHGAAAARLLLDAMRPDGDSTPLAIDAAAADLVADVELIVRSSTGPVDAPPDR